MGGRSRIISIVVAFIAVVLFIFAIMPHYFFVAMAAQVRPPVDFSLSPNACCGSGMTYPTPGYQSTFNASAPPTRSLPRPLPRLGVDVFGFPTITIERGEGCN